MLDWAANYSDMRENTPVLCVYGKGDAKSKAVSDMIVDKMLVAAPPKNSKLNPLPNTVTKVIDGVGPKNTGIGLIDSSLKTEDLILKYLEALEKDRKNATKVNKRNYNLPPYIHPASFGVQLK